MLATGTGADHAAAFGLPLVMTAARGEERMLRAVDGYRVAFRPSSWAQRPYVVVTADVAVAGSGEAARRLLVPEAWSSAYSRTHGVFPPLMPAEAVLGLEMSARERTLFEQAREHRISGTEDEVAQALGSLVGRTGADEVLVTLSTYDRGEMLDSYRRLARLVAEPRAGRGNPPGVARIFS